MTKTKAKTVKEPVEQIGENLKKSTWSSIGGSVILIIFGILLLIWPGVVLSVAANVLGTILIVGGAYQIINYFVVKGQNDFFNNSLLTGVVSMLIGIAAILIGDDIANVFRVVVGIWMIYEALVRVNAAIKLHAAKVSAWSYELIIALILLAVGIFVTFNTGAVVQLIGGMMILSGIVGIVGDAMFIQQINTVVKNLTKQS